MKAVRVGGAAVLAAVLVGSTMFAASGQIVINEIAWTGTGAASSDEWIELHNPTEDAIDLAGWALTFGDVTIHLDVAEEETVEVRRSVIGAGGYFLLERTDDAAVSDVEADIVYRGSLSNDGADVRLIDAGGLVVDAALFAESGWPAGTASDGIPPYGSMEREESDLPDWNTNDGVIRNGLDADGQPINGTPGRANSATILAATAPRIELVHPSGETESIGGLYTIEWSASDPDDPATSLGVSIYLWCEQDDEWELVVENLANTGSFLWNTAAGSAEGECRLRLVVTDPEGHVGEAISPAFRIEPDEG